MAFVPIADTVQVDLVGSIDGQTVVWGWQWERAGGWSIGGAETHATDVYAWWDTYLKSQISTDYSLDIIRITDLSSASGFVYEWTDDLPTPGGNVADAVPNNVSVVVSFKTGNRGRAFRGRCYIPGVFEGAFNSSTLSSAAMTAFEAAFAASTSIGTVLGADQVVASRSTNPGFTTVVTSFVVRPYAKTQKRRLPK